MGIGNEISWVLIGSKDKGSARISYRSCGKNERRRQRLFYKLNIFVFGNGKTPQIV